jgi:TATA-box binding protein (TBP) (component of TFIID and TFIIIB)
MATTEHKEKAKANSKSKELIFKATPISISTCTVLTSTNSKINLGLLSRFVPIYEQYDPELDNKTGGIYNLEFYGNCARGETLIDNIKDEFNNQATIKFKYWGFRNVNIKVFANGKLQMTGLKYEAEAIEVAKFLILILNNIKINIINNITQFSNIPKTYDFQLLYDEQTQNVTYYRKYYDRFLKDYNFNTDILSNSNGNGNGNGIGNTNGIKQNTVNYNRKGFIKGIHDKYNQYSDLIEEQNYSILNSTDWYGDNYIKIIINKIENLKEYFTSELESTLSNSKTLIEVKQGVELLMKKYTDFKFAPLDKLLSDISKNMFSLDEQTLIDIKHEIFKFNRVYKHFLEKKINRLITIRTLDINICNYVKDYLLKKNSIGSDDSIGIGNTDDVVDTQITNIPIEKLELSSEIITEPHNYFVSNTETVLINSDLSINHNINLKKISKILKRNGLYNSYEPDEYPGVLTKYYYNDNNTVQGICNCSPHCSTKEKHSICTKITISVFRPGSVIITGARNTIQLMAAHDFIIKILKDNLEYIKGTDYEDDNKHIAIMNNEFRKISKKPRLFFIKKNNIVDFEKLNNDC